MIDNRVLIEDTKKLWEENQIFLNIPLIDLQHIWLVSLIIKLNDLITNHESSKVIQEIKSLFLEVFNFISEHFAVEEKIFKEYNYPEIKNHIEHHKKLVVDVKNYYNDLDKNEFVIANGLHLMLNKWLFIHIKQEDSKYTEYFTTNSLEITSFIDGLINRRIIKVSSNQMELYKEVTGMPEFVPVKQFEILNQIINIWNENKLSINIPAIDTQHVWLVKMIVEMEDAMKIQDIIKRNDIFQSVVLKAINYASEHFALEEAIMRSYKYHEYKQHSDQHKKFVEFVKLRNEQNRAGDYNSGMSLIQDLKDWLFNHIAKEDTKLKQYFQNNLDMINTFVQKLIVSGQIKLRDEQIEYYTKVINS